MADIQLTAQQRGAVEDRGGSLLVSAAAGSGKTKVLVERVFAYLTEEHCHIDDFLIITFTRAAAAELRTKLAAELAKRVAQDPENSHLRQQMFRVYQADIKTVDGFCVGLLREHIHLLEPVDAHLPAHFLKKRDEHIPHHGRVIGGTVVVEGGQVQMLRYDVQLVLVQLR